MSNVNVLVTSAGVMSAVNVIKSLRIQHEIDINIIATDIDPYAPGLHLADKYYISPSIKKKKVYLEFLFDIIRKHNVSVLYPCYSNEIEIISENLNLFERIGANILIPPISVINLCNNKLEISKFVSSINIPVPKIIIKPTKKDLPLFSKMLSGSSSVGATLIEDELHLMSCLSNDKRMYQEYINGMEYTVDTLCDRDSNVLIAAPRKRLVTKSGQTVKGVTVNNTIIDEYVKKICKSVGLIGACNIQFIEKDNEYFFIEINPRYAAGGLMLTVNAGANIPLLALKIMLGIPISNKELEHKANIVMTRYWEEIIIQEHNNR